LFTLVTPGADQADVERLVKLLDAKLEVQSEVGKGSMSALTSLE
jgi:hypothetical protein